jgi:hypothetical protein
MTVDFVFEASRRAAVGMRARHALVFCIQATLATVASSATVLRGTMAWVSTRHLQLSVVRRG